MGQLIKYHVYCKECGRTNHFTLDLAQVKEESYISCKSCHVNLIYDIMATKLPVNLKETKRMGILNPWQASPELTMKGAFISADKQYRYWLTRVWDNTLGLAGWIMLNPSTADHLIDDKTTIRCINYAKAWGYGGIILVNLFAYRSKHPDDLKKAADPIGPDNDFYIRSALTNVSIKIAAWGSHGSFMGRDKVILSKYNDLCYLAKTNDGMPRHPLYLPKNLTPKMINEPPLVFMTKPTVSGSTFNQQIGRALRVDKPDFAKHEVEQTGQPSEWVKND